MNIYLYVLGADSAAPMIMLVASILIIIASIVVHCRMGSGFGQKTIISRDIKSLDPTQWGAYEKSMRD